MTDKKTPVPENNAATGQTEEHVVMFFPHAVRFTGEGHRQYTFGPGTARVPAAYADNAWLRARGMQTPESMGMASLPPLGVPAPAGSMAARAAAAQSGVAYGETASQAAAREEAAARIGLTTAQVAVAASETPQQRALREEAEAKAARTDAAEKAAREAEQRALDAEKRAKELEDELAKAKKK